MIPEVHHDQDEQYRPTAPQYPPVQYPPHLVGQYPPQYPLPAVPQYPAGASPAAAGQFPWAAMMAASKYFLPVSDPAKFEPRALFSGLEIYGTSLMKTKSLKIKIVYNIHDKNRIIEKKNFTCQGTGSGLIRGDLFQFILFFGGTGSISSLTQFQVQFLRFVLFFVNIANF